MSYQFVRYNNSNVDPLTMEITYNSKTLYKFTAGNGTNTWSGSIPVNVTTISQELSFTFGFQQFLPGFRSMYIYAVQIA